LYRTREGSLKWRAGASIEFVLAPDGFSVEGGWWRSSSGRESAWRPLESGEGGVWTLPETLDARTLGYAALPADVMAIEESALNGCMSLTRLELPSNVITNGENALREC
jgi:hypothetical protein